MTFIYTILLFLFLNWLLSSDLSILSENGLKNKMKDVTIGMKHRVQRTRHIYTHAYMYTSAASHDVSRWSSRQILFRKIGLPLSSTTERQQLCVDGSFPATNNVRANACEKLSRLSPRSSPPSFPFLLCAPDRDTTRIFGIFQPQGAILT